MRRTNCRHLARARFIRFSSRVRAFQFSFPKATCVRLLIGVSPSHARSAATTFCLITHQQLFEWHFQTCLKGVSWRPFQLSAPCVMIQSFFVTGMRHLTNLRRPEHSPRHAVESENRGPSGLTLASHGKTMLKKTANYLLLYGLLTFVFTAIYSRFTSSAYALGTATGIAFVSLVLPFFIFGIRAIFNRKLSPRVITVSRFLWLVCWAGAVLRQVLR